MSLRSKVLQGSAYLVLREGLGMVITIATVFLITRVIGPASYGVFAAAIGLVLFVINFGHLWIGVYLVRHEGEDHPHYYHQAFTIILGLSLAVTGVMLGLTPWLERWINIDGFGNVFPVMAGMIPVVSLMQVPLSKLERDLEFKRIAMIELIGQLVSFMVSFPLAMKGFGAWAPALGWCAQQAQIMVLTFLSARYRPQLHWDPVLSKQMMAYSLNLSASSWVWYLRTLVNPLVVGRFAGETAVGYVALAVRLLDTLSFAKSATYRISISVLARFQDDPLKLRRAISEGMELQLLVLGPLLVFTSWVGPIALPIVFGAEWAPAMAVFPFIALPYLMSGMFNLHCSVLSVLNRLGAITLFHSTYVAIFIGLAFWLVSQFGLLGYGWAEAIATLAYGLTHWYVTQAIGSPDYRLAAVWCTAFGLALFPYQLGWWVVVGLIAAILFPATGQKIRAHLQLLKTDKA